MAKMRERKTAIVQCFGNCVNRDGLAGGTAAENCEQAAEMCRDDGTNCQWGCLGGGSCAAVCKPGAIHIGSRGIAVVDHEICTGCGLCVKACPRNLIRLTAWEYPIYPACVSEDKGSETRKVCVTGCIDCGSCVRNCPADAISIINHHAVIDKEKCIACGMCAVKCPRGAIRDLNGIFTVREEQVKI